MTGQGGDRPPPAPPVGSPLGTGAQFGPQVDRTVTRRAKPPLEKGVGRSL